MSKTLKTVGIVLGAAALIATGIGAVAGTGVLLGTTFIPATTIGAVASALSVAASLGAQQLAKPPPARGSLSQIMIAVDPPTPYVMGEGYFAGVLRYDVGYGGTVDKVVNPYRWMVIDYSGSGPVESISPRVDYTAVSSYYTGFLTTDTQLGACPESTALTETMGTAPGWGSTYKLSGQAAIGWNLKFDKSGKKFASGVPLLGAYLEGVKAYDPRLDSTFPGGSGTCRIDDETTFVYSENPALHAGTYCYGRYQNGKRVFGIGLPTEGIDWVTIAAWANVCDANGWTLYGVAYEPGDRGQNLIDICAAGGAVPVFASAVMSFRYSAPVVALDTITEADIADAPGSVTAQQSYRNRLNTIVPKYRSSAHNWEMVDAEAVQEAGFLSDDGEERREVWPLNFVKDVDQAAILASYKLWDGRELHPIELVCMPRMRAYRPGDCLALDLPQLGLDTDAIIVAREIDPATMQVRLTLIGETPAKHAYILGLTGVAPETPTLGQTGEEADEIIGENLLPPAYLAQLIAASYVTDADPADGLIEADDTGSPLTITIETHTRTYTDTAAPVSITGDSITTEDDASTAFVPDVAYHIYYDDATRAGGAVTYLATQDAQSAATSGANPARHYLGSITPSTGAVVTSPGAAPSGWEPGEYCVADDTPILLADGTKTPAAMLAVADMVRTLHEETLEWGDWPVTNIAFAVEPVFACELEGANGAVVIRATAGHRFHVGGEWVRAGDIGMPDGTARVAKITVADAHTYVSDGVLSHNIKA